MKHDALAGILRDRVHVGKRESGCEPPRRYARRPIHCPPVRRSAGSTRRPGRALHVLEAHVFAPTALILRSPCSACRHLAENGRMRQGCGERLSPRRSRRPASRRPSGRRSADGADAADARNHVARPDLDQSVAGLHGRDPVVDAAQHVACRRGRIGRGLGLIAAGGLASDFGMDDVTTGSATSRSDLLDPRIVLVESGGAVSPARSNRAATSRSILSTRASFAYLRSQQQPRASAPHGSRRPASAMLFQVAHFFDSACIRVCMSCILRASSAECRTRAAELRSAAARRVRLAVPAGP